MGSESKPRSIPVSELCAHNTASDLWVAISGDVYDLTSWLARHPGGDLPLLTVAGTDATDAFAAFHPASARRLLPPFLVGRLADDSPPSPVLSDFRKLHADLRSAGLFDRPGLQPYRHLALMVSLLALALLLLRVSPLLAGACLGWLWIQSGWMGHDSGHAPLPGGRVVQLLSGNCLTGLSIAWWKRNHNEHHLACNSLDHDPDLQHMPLFAVSGRLFANLYSVFYGRVMPFNAFSRLLISQQHWTFYPIMCIARINLLAQSMIYLVSGKNVPRRLEELAAVAVFWLWYPLIVVTLPTWPDRIGFLLMSFAVTGIQHVQFCLNHFSSPVFVGPPRDGNWVELQTSGTIDVTCPPWMDWFHGGLQFQIEHHLFPRLPRVYLRNIAPAVRALCKKHGLPYTAVSFLEANLMTVRTLRDAAMEARRADKGAKNLVWEAMNTHG